MAVNKVVYDGRTLVDLTNDTVTAGTLAEGATAHTANGERVVGTLTAVQYGSAQSLTAAQKTQARSNIGAASVEQVSQLSAEIDAIGTQEDIVQQVIIALGTPVFGTVNDDKKITLNANLAEGNYDVGYEDKDGNFVSIGFWGVGGASGTFDIPIEWEMGIKLSKTDNTYETVSTDHTTATSTYAASQHVYVEDGAVYTVGMVLPDYHTISVCCYAADGSLISYLEAVVKGPKEDVKEPMQSDIALPAGTASFRLRLTIAINKSNPADQTLRLAGPWLTKTL